MIQLQQKLNRILGFENSYLKLFQIANQNLTLLQQEEKAIRYGRRYHKRRKVTTEDE